MKTILFTLLASGAQLAWAQQVPTLTVDRIMQDPKWIGSSPLDPCWRFDSKSLFFQWNPDQGLSDSAYQYFLTGQQPAKAKFADAELARSMRSGTYNREHSELAYVFRGDIYVLNIGNGEITRITRTEWPKSGPAFSGHGRWVTYICQSNLFSWNPKESSTRQLTDFVRGESPEPAKPNAQERWLLAEQLRTSSVLKERKEKREKRRDYLRWEKGGDTLRKIYIGNRAVENLQIDPEGRYITYALVEESKDAREAKVPEYISESGFPIELEGRTLVGAPQGKTECFLYDRVRDTVIRIIPDSLPGMRDRPTYLHDYPGKTSDPIALRSADVQEVKWNDAGTACVLDIRSRDHKDRWLALLDPQNGTLRLADRQHDEAWIAGPGIGWNSRASLGWIDDWSFYFQSEATGFSQLYRIDARSLSKLAVTHGAFEIEEVILSRDKMHFYILTNETHPGKRQFYRIQTDGSEKVQLTSLEGGYEVSLSPDEKYLAYRYSTQNRPWELYIQENLPGKKPRQVTMLAMSEAWKSYPWRDPQIFQYPARDGKLIYARIYEPIPGKKNGAAVLFVHGAGYLQNETFSWSYYFREFMFNNLLADKGYTVMDIDYRASAGYGRDWRTGIYRHMGGKDLDDEVDAARFLISQRGIDSSRIGMYGGSYGGFMTLMALFTQPGVFRAGAALRPVTDWAHYNHEYTSAILNEPFTDSLAYERSSPINFAAGLRDHLLICHGMIDDNVHFQDAVRLSQRLIELGKTQWELAVYPLESHGFVEASSWTDEYRRILSLFDSCLGRRP
jgi:dipeptidyl aminopeptidase/acylaminoacyl peptidase